MYYILMTFANIVLFRILSFIANKFILLCNTRHPTFYSWEYISENNTHFSPIKFSKNCIAIEIVALQNDRPSRGHILSYIVYGLQNFTVKEKYSLYFLKKITTSFHDSI